MDFFLVDSTPFQWFSIHTCIPSLLKTSLFCFFLFFQDGEGVGAKGLCDVVCNPEEPLALPPPKSGLLSFVNFSSVDTRLRLAEGVRPVEPLEESEHNQWWQTQQVQVDNQNQV